MAEVFPPLVVCHTTALLFSCSNNISLKAFKDCMEEYRYASGGTHPDETQDTVSSLRSSHSDWNRKLCHP